MNHIVKIDVLRGIAIILVLYHHFNIPYKLQLGILPGGQSLTNIIARNGNYGVTMFFVVSGFLITQTVLKRTDVLSNIQLKSFYIRRVARILPCLVLLVVIVTVLGWRGLAPFINHQPNGIDVSYTFTVLAAFTFSMNVLIIKYGWVNYALGVLWSLSVEEAFYLVFPILLKVFKKRILFYSFLIAIIFIAPCVRSFYYLDENEAYLYAYFASFDAIAIGVLTALFWNKLKVSNWVSYLAMLLMVILYLIAPIKEVSTWSISLFALGTAILILSFNHQNTKTTVSYLQGIFMWLGRRSYELYLFHLIILGLAKSFFIPQQTPLLVKLVLLVIYLLGTVILSYVIERYYSSPLNNYIRKRFIS